MDSLPWIFCIIKPDEVCARAWTTTAFQASKNFRDGAQTHVEARANASLKASRCIQLRSCGEKAAISLTSSAWRLVSVLAKIRPRCVFTVDSAILRLRAVSRRHGFARR